MTIDLAPIKARLAAASPGPWEHYSAMCCPDMGGVSGPRGTVCAHQVGRFGHPMSIEDAEFIAHSKADVEALVAEVERLRYQRLDDGAVDGFSRFAGLPGLRDRSILSDWPGYHTHWTQIKEGEKTDD